MVGDPQELDKKVNITLKLVIWACGITFALGILFAEVMFSFDETEGLRSDWSRSRKEDKEALDKELKRIWLEIEKNKKADDERLDHLEDYHENPIGN